MTGKVLLGLPELLRMAKGEAITVRIKPGTEAMELRLSVIAQAEMKPKPASKTQDFMDRMKAELGI